MTAWRKARLDRRPTGQTGGLILAVTVTAASLSENAVGIQLLDQAKKTYPTISKSWVDTGFKNAVIDHGASLGIDVEVVRQPHQAHNGRDDTHRQLYGSAPNTIPEAAWFERATAVGGGDLAGAGTGR